MVTLSMVMTEMGGGVGWTGDSFVTCHFSSELLNGDGDLCTQGILKQKKHLVSCLLPALALPAMSFYRPRTQANHGWGTLKVPPMGLCQTL